MDTLSADSNRKIKDGHVAVLISPNYGAGWSSWASGDEHTEFLLFDPGLVSLAERKDTEKEVQEYCKTVFGSDFYTYLGGWSSIEIVWVPVGTYFEVTEYDGYEELQYKERPNWHVA